jgi:CRP-like cAMP-binding protein
MPASIPHDTLVANLGRHISLSEDELALFCARLRPHKVKRKEFLLRQGEIARDSAFVVSGCMKAYATDTNGFEHILRFATPGWWVSDLSSFITKRQSQLAVEAVRDTQLLLLSRSDQLELFDRIPKLERYFRILMENALVTTQMRLMDNMTLTARERYQRFCRMYPELVNEIPLKLIASFIGVTPEFLSRIRAAK